MLLLAEVYYRIFKTMNTEYKVLFSFRIYFVSLFLSVDLKQNKNHTASSLSQTILIQQSN